MNKIIEAVKQGTPIYLSPYKEPKVWGIKGIGEYWYGAEKGKTSSIAIVGKDTIPMADIMDAVPSAVIGEEVAKAFGRFLPLVKILTPRGRLSVQFHDSKNELWVVTGIKRAIAGASPGLIIGFNPEAVKKYGKKVKEKYREALESYGDALNVLIDELEKKGHKKLLMKKGDVVLAARAVEKKNNDVRDILSCVLRKYKGVEYFYNYIKVRIGDVIPVPQGTLHALGSGIEVVEPQIPGPTQSLEDGATYPVRYYFPGYQREGSKKQLDLGRVGEMDPGIWKKGKTDILKRDKGVKIERLPGGFEDKGMEVHRITMSKGTLLEYPRIKSYHTLVSIKGEAKAVINNISYSIPHAVAGGKMLLVPASSVNYVICAVRDTEIIDTFTPV